jgi:membrane protease YdiL (CAAX protease family)
VRTVIGQRLTSSRAALAAASVVGALVVLADLALVWARSPDSLEARGVLAVIVLAAHVRLVEGDLDSVGLRLTPAQGWWYWVRVSLWIGLAVLAFIVVGLGTWVLSGRELPVYATSPAELGPAFLRMCLSAPVLEEVIYRLAPCVPLAALLGPWRAVAVSGLAFAALHLVAGNPGPENLVGGFFLAWAYLKSGSLAVPVLLHGLGNLCALAAQVGAWYWLRGAV